MSLSTTTPTTLLPLHSCLLHLPLLILQRLPPLLPPLRLDEDNFDNDDHDSYCCYDCGRCDYHHRLLLLRPTSLHCDMRTPLPASIPTDYPTTTHTELNRDRNLMNNGRERKDRSACPRQASMSGASFKAALFGFSIVKWSECQSAAGSGCH